MSKKQKTKTKDDFLSYVPSDSERVLIEEILDCYRAAYTKKQALGLDTLWQTCQDYWAGDVNFPEDDDDPGSETNIIQPIIESQVADIVKGDIDILVKGTGPSDQMFANDVTQVLKWIWLHNSMTRKLDSGERDRLNLGNCPWKILWDKDAMSGRGIVSITPFSPASFFPDPKINDVEFLQDADYMIQTHWFSLKKLVRIFGEKAKFVQPEPGGMAYDPRLFDEDTDIGSNPIINDQACLYEYWTRKENGKLRLVYCTRDVVLADSDDDDEAAMIPQECDKYPFVLILGYKKLGRLWGMGDTEQLINTQDIINDLDDQIRMNARMMGNGQIVYNKNAGINAKKWTNTPGLKVPANDHTAFQVVQQPYMPAYITNRRDRAFDESELISGRSDVVEGRRSGSLRAASAILALQEAGSRRANHKSLMLQVGVTEVLNIALEYAKEFMDAEQAFDITENDKTDYLWFKPSELKSIPQLTLNENFDARSDNVALRGKYKPLLDEAEDGSPSKPMTKNAEFDIEVHLGAGMPNNKSFLYEATLEMAREGIATIEEARAVIKQVLNWPIIDPYKPVGTFGGRNLPKEQLSALNGNGMSSVVPPQEVAPTPTPSAPQTMPGMMPQQPVQVDPAMIQNLISLVQNGQLNTEQLNQVLSQLPPEALDQMLFMLQGSQQMAGAPK